MRQRRFGRWALSLALLVAACVSSENGTDSESHFVCASDEECRVELGYGYECVARECRVADKDAGPTTMPDAAPEAAPSASGGTGGVPLEADVALCQGAPPARSPSRPAPSEVPNTGRDINFVNAMYTIDWGDREAAPMAPTHYLNIGLDLDNECTTQEDPDLGECNLPSWGTGFTDGPGGIDNATGSIIQELRDRTTSFSSEAYTQSIQEGGRANLLVRVSSYNGAPNDDQVRVETFVAAPFDALNPPAGDPRWDGTDVWNVADDSVGPGGLTDPLSFDDRAYVKDGQLAAILPTTTLRLDFPLSSTEAVKLDMALTAAALVCDLTEIGSDAGASDSWQMVCTLAGRWETDNLLHQVSQFPDPLDIFSPLCTDSTSYTALKTVICRPTDVYVGMIEPGAICNALSVGVHFSTKPALLGDLYALEPLTPRCPTEFEPSNDSCDPGILTDGGT